MVDPRAYWNLNTPRRGAESSRKPVSILAEHLPSGCILYRPEWQTAVLGEEMRVSVTYLSASPDA